MEKCAGHVLPRADGREGAPLSVNGSQVMVLRYFDSLNTEKLTFSVKIYPGQALTMQPPVPDLSVFVS